MDNLSIKIGQYSSKGIKDQNEDAFGIFCPQGEALKNKGISAVIADGMGSCEYPKQASYNCVHGFINDYYSTPDSWTVKSSAAKVLTALNSWLFGQGLNTHAKAYVSTFSAIILKSTTGHIFHSGDSRIYRFRKCTKGGELTQLTTDHRLWVSDKENYLSRAIGIDLYLDIDYKRINLELEDIFVMTTDGVHDFIQDKEIKALLYQGLCANESKSLDTIAKEIVKHSLASKSHDNVTCQMFQISTLPSQQKDEVYDELVKLPFPPDLETGMILDDFKVLKEINASARSQLYLVEDMLTHKKLVMKTPSVNFEDDPAYLEQFSLEEWAGKRLNHANLLMTYDFKNQLKYKKRTALYFLMEHIDACPLSQWISDNPQPDINTVLDILDQIIKGVRSIHRMEMLHRDLKPDNVMIDKEGKVKVIDFGSIKIAGVSETSSPISRHELLGTKDYTAPEYLLGVAASKQSDLFSIASICYELLTGKLPYGDQLNKTESINKLGQLKYMPSYHYNPMIPLWFDGALKKALDCNVNVRYQSLSEFFTDLKNPNEIFFSQYIPLIERNPLGLWKAVAILSIFINLLLMSYLL